METQQQLFLPVIKSGGADDSLRAAKSALRSLYALLLSQERCAAAVARFKSNGSQMGHKVLDDSAAVDALMKAASAEIAEQCKAIDLSQWDRCQVLNQVLRRHFELDKHGKLTGAPSKRIQQMSATG